MPGKVIGFGWTNVLIWLHWGSNTSLMPFENDQDMVAKEESVSDAESGWSGVSDNSSTDSECTDVEASSLASDQDRFDTTYDAFRDLANDLYDIDLRRYPRGVTSEDGQEKLQELVHLPRT